LQQDKKDWLTNIPRLAVVGVSDWITNEARESILKSTNIISKVYNWIDVEVFKPIDTKLLRCEMHLNDKFMILGVASEWSNAKGLDKFIEIANILKDNAVVVLVGNISVKDTVLPQNMVNIPETHDVNKLVEYYSMANVLLNLSMEESFGKVSAESLACGTPVITINSTANSEIVGSDCGYVIKTSKTNDILKAIELVRDNGKEYYTDNCIQYAKSNFLLDERVNDYLNIYKQILGLN
jgi:glycosyltransferase involved in cell wall biosynthesis